ncbi:hypothetical protein ACA910_011067 [Epithemia clementina (nom. ined.)]
MRGDDDTTDSEVLLPAPASWFGPHSGIPSANTETGLIETSSGQAAEISESTSITTEMPSCRSEQPLHHDSCQRLEAMPTSNTNVATITNTMHFVNKEEDLISVDADPCIIHTSAEHETPIHRTARKMKDSTTTITTTTNTNGNQQQRIGAPLPSPSWTEISSQVVPAAAHELFSNSLRRLCHSARLSYVVTTEWRQEYQEIGAARGYFRNECSPTSSSPSDDLPPFSSLPWIERQMVQEWRTYSNNGTNQQSQQQRSQQQTVPNNKNNNSKSDNDADENSSETDSSTHSLSSSFDSTSSDEPKIHSGARARRNDDEEDEDEFIRARTLVPRPKLRPTWQHAETCFTCYKPFGPTRLRHHCRLCGCSFCQAHSSYSYPLPHLGYKVPERVCDECRARLVEHNLAERVSWRLARCRDLTEETLCPYFDVGVDTMHDMAIRITNAALTMAKTIPLGAQATVAVETLEVLRRYGLNGIYTILLRQEFLAAADMLRKALGIDSKSWPLSVHELSAAIFYALAQHRALRGLYPEREHVIHAVRNANCIGCSDSGDGDEKPLNNTLLESIHEVKPVAANSLISEVGLEHLHKNNDKQQESNAQDKLVPVCEELPDSTLNALIFYAPLALSFIYAEKEVDMQLLAAQQGWRLLYAYLQHREPRQDASVLDNRPSSAVFVHEKHRIACLAIRGTTTIHDVVTDIRQVPVPFPEPEMYKVTSEDWTTMSDAQGLAVSGMVGAALNLYREHVDSLLYLALEGYRIRLVGHSLGGAVAALIGVLLRHDFPALKQETTPESKRVDQDDNLSLRVYSYGTPACVDARLSDIVEDFAVAAVLHDDAVPRLSPASCRGLLKHLLHIRDTWVKEHLPNDLMAITERAKLVWAPRWREGFTLLSTPSSSSIKRYCRKQYNKGKKKIMSIKDKILKAADEQFGPPTKDLDEQTLKLANGVETIQHEDGSISCIEAADDDPIASMSETRLLVDYMGGIDHQTSGLVIDGDEFFEANGSSLVEDEAEDENFEDAVNDLVHQQEKEMSTFLQTAKSTSDASVNSPQSSDEETPEVVVLAETPLPRLYVPGKIVHIYSHRGVYRAVYVPRSFRELRQISMAGNMLADHKCKAYFEALLEVRTVRLAPENPPRWTAFDEDDTCACCASRFTWASTSNSKAQEARDKHNCRSCGTLVCNPCSSNRVPLPSLGLTCPVRVCDRCYHDIDGIMSKSDGIVDETGSVLAPVSDASRKPERVRQRRSEVVDELVSRITTPGLL